MNLISEIIGNFGIFHLQSLFVLCLLKMPVNWTIIIIPIISPLLENKNFCCKKTGDYKPGTKCYLPNKQPCTEFEYKDYYYIKTITQQFNIVCGRRYLMGISQFANSVGVFLGFAIGTNVWHLVSPRTMIVSGIWAYSISSILTGKVFNYGQHLVFRSLTGFVGALLSCSSHMICAEITTDAVRLKALVVLEGFLALGDIVLVNCAVYFDTWCDVYTFAGFLILALYLLKDLVPEAPNWLLRRGMVKEAKALVVKAAISNERVDHIPKNLVEKLEELAIEYVNQNVKYGDLWKDEKTCKNLFLAHIVSTCILMCFLGLTQIIRTIQPPKFQLSSIFLSLADFSGSVLALFVCKCYNRQEKWSILALFNICGGIICYFGLFMPTTIVTLSEYFAWIFLICVPKLCVTFARCLLLASLTDFTESKFRKNFVFSNIAFSRLIACINPLIFFYLNNDKPLRLLIFYGTVELVGGVLIIFLRIPIGEGSDIYAKTGHKVIMNTIASNLLGKSETGFNSKKKPDFQEQDDSKRSLPEEVLKENDLSRY